MKKILFIFSFLVIVSCESDDQNRFCDIINSQTINLVNPQFNNIQVSGGWNYANGGPKGIIIYNFNNSFRAFSRECPQLDCTDKMTVENDIRIVCPCDTNEYSILDGSPITSGVSKSVCEFKVTQVSSAVLNITNF